MTAVTAKCSPCLGHFPDLYEGPNPGRDEDEQRRLLVHQVEEDDGLAERPPEDRLPTQSLHRLFSPPEVDVTFKREEVEQQVDGGDP